MKIIFMADGASSGQMDNRPAAQAVQQAEARKAKDISEGPPQPVVPNRGGAAAGRGGQVGSPHTDYAEMVTGKTSDAKATEDAAKATDSGKQSGEVTADEGTQTGGEAAGSGGKPQEEGEGTGDKEPTLAEKRAAIEARVRQEHQNPDDPTKATAEIEAQFAILNNAESTPEALYGAYQELNGVMGYDELMTFFEGDERRKDIPDIAVSKALVSLDQDGWFDSTPPELGAELKIALGDTLSEIFAPNKTADERANAIFALQLPEDGLTHLLSLVGDKSLSDEVVRLVKNKQEIARMQQTPAAGEMSTTAGDDAPPEGDVGELTPVPVEMQDAIDATRSALDVASDSTASADVKAKAAKDAKDSQNILKKIFWDYAAKTHFRKVVKVGGGILAIPGVPFALLLMITFLIHVPGKK